LDLCDDVDGGRPDRYAPRLKTRRRHHYDRLTGPRAKIKRKMVNSRASVLPKAFLKSKTLAVRWRRPVAGQGRS